MIIFIEHLMCVVPVWCSVYVVRGDAVHLLQASPLRSHVIKAGKAHNCCVVTASPALGSPGLSPRAWMEREHSGEPGGPSEDFGFSSDKPRILESLE